MAETSGDASAFRRHGSRRPALRRALAGVSRGAALPRALRVLALALIIAVNGAQWAQAQSTAGRLAVPPAETLLLLIRTTLVALNHANQTGNYTVLRDLSAPVFQAKFSAADLAGIFADLRKRRIDLAPAVIVSPEVSEPPTVSTAGHLTITGHFPTRPAPINFRLIYVAADGLWKLGGITVDVPTVPAAAEPSPASETPAAGSETTPRAR